MIAMGCKKETAGLRDAAWLHHHFEVKCMTALEIAHMLSCQPSTVHRALHRHGIKLTKPKHYMRGTKVYQAWIDMIRRCNDPGRDSYPHYGGRGIKVCDRWMLFENFYADMGSPLPELSLDRKNTNGDYEQSNCRWATITEQARNKTTSRFVIVDGEKLNVKTAAVMYGLSPGAIMGRLARGMSDDEAVKTPSRNKNKRWKKL